MQISDLPVHHKIISRLQEKGFESLTEIQQQTILPAIQGKDIVASSKTGSGKTLAFLIPTINRLLNTKALSRQDPRVLILAPTRELAKQVFIEAKSLSGKLGIQCALVVGGENFNDQVKVLRRSPHIIVGTAGRIADHLTDKSFFINGLELLIFDEADRMLDLGFASQLNQINHFADHRKRQTMLFSATLDNLALSHLTKSLLKAPVRVSVGESNAEHVDIAQSVFFADDVNHKDAMLLACLQQQSYNQAVIFTATREDTNRLADALNAQNLHAIGLRGDLPQHQRAQIMSEFGRGQHSILVTTDVASRGLDLLKVGLVINFDLPKQTDEYIHRIGRTGRAGQKGVAISFVGPRDWRSFQAIQNHVAYPLLAEKHPELPSTFTGREAPQKASQRATTSDHPARGSLKNGAKPIVKKRVNTLEGKNVGELPVMRKKGPRRDLKEDDDNNS
ncbi:DEAD/DEAH box helicase [Alteromonas pelagimontana]|uniref:DEAD/DEAH box helicase n=1 Tax=Alteromonas pelagimontana TaxID=1858656 RepID=A0A6M4MIW6_9ALTE|nr:DEAD/DEAH box helicase [Alteromonas pelagimontana]QJR82575.1 DEAD/DEAH box helicase [Alteromonas pelagimontana]